MAQAEAQATTILAFPTKRKHPVRNPRLTNAEFRECGAHLLNEELYQKPYRTVEALLLHALLMALPPEYAVKVASVTGFWADENRFDAVYRQGAACALATMEHRVRKASRELDRQAARGAS